MKKILSLILVFVLAISFSVTAFAADFPMPSDVYGVSIENGNTFIGNIDTSNLTQAEKDFLQDFFDVMYRGKSSSLSYMASMSVYQNQFILYFFKISGTVRHLWQGKYGAQNFSFCSLNAGASGSQLTFSFTQSSPNTIIKVGGGSFTAGADVVYSNIFFTKNFDVPAVASSFLTHTGNIYFRGDNPDIFYTPEVPQHNLTINYKYTDGTQAAESVTTPYDVAAEYNVTSPVIDGYMPDLTAVTGVMGESDVTVDVTYTKNLVANTLTINYNYADGSQAAETHVSQYIANMPYAVTSPAIEGFTPNPATVAGRMGETDIVTTVIYTKNSTGGGTGGGGNVYDPFAPPNLGDYNGYNPFALPSLDNWTGNNPFEPPSLGGWTDYDPFVNPFFGSYSGYDPFIFKGARLWNMSYLTYPQLKKCTIQSIII